VDAWLQHFGLQSILHWLHEWVTGASFGSCWQNEVSSPTFQLPSYAIVGFPESFLICD